jgi:hypothetical protein
MDKTAVVFLVVAIVAVGLYIGATNLYQQYGIEAGGSQAGQYACEPDKSTATLSESIKFISSLPEGSRYYWSAPDGLASFVIGGPLTVRYARTGPKSVFLFYLDGNIWRYSTCSVQIK